jgi:ElaB/YqjD/DUF883 family membrane-anchored ribosome-binding protein
VKRTTKSTARRRVADIHDEVAGIGEQVSSLGKALGDTASDEAREALDSIRKGLDRIMDDAGSLTRAGVGELRGTIQESPFIGVAVGIGVGFILASMLRR